MKYQSILSIKSATLMAYKISKTLKELNIFLSLIVGEKTVILSYIRSL